LRLGTLEEAETKPWNSTARAHGMIASGRRAYYSNRRRRARALVSASLTFGPRLAVQRHYSSTHFAGFDATFSLCCRSIFAALADLWFRTGEGFAFIRYHAAGKMALQLSISTRIHGQQYESGITAKSIADFGYPSTSFAGSLVDFQSRL
jgi:hypothetical protein